MNFRKYPSIENTYRSKTIKQIHEQGLSGGEWVVLNKIHGANFALYSNGTKVKPAKRTDWIKEKDGNFGNCIKVVSKYRDILLDITDILKGIYGSNNIVFMGELFGGHYPHPDVKKVDHAVRIQKGVFYCPHNEFYLFDITVDCHYMNHEVVEYIGKTWDIPYAKPLFRGTFEECLKFEHEFEDKTYEIFSLPKIEIKNDTNWSEGIVIKPEEPKFFGNGKRVILKNKNDKFQERSSRKKREPKAVHEWSVNGAKLYSTLSTYVTEPRLINVLSHGHIIGQKDFGKLMGLLNKDIFDDFIKDYGDNFECLEIKEQKMIKNAMNKWSADLIRPNFLNIIDGEY